MELVIPSLNILRKPFYTRKMRKITVQNNESFDLTDYPVQILIQGQVRPDFVCVQNGKVVPHWVRRIWPDFAEIYACIDLPTSGQARVELYYEGHVWDSLYPWSPGEAKCFSDDFRSAGAERFYTMDGDYDMSGGVLHGYHTGWFTAKVTGLSLQDVYAEFSMKPYRGWCVLQIRNIDGSNRYWFGYNGSSMGLRKRVNGTWSNPKTFSGSASVWHHFKVKMVGSSYEMWEMDRDSNLRTYSSKISGTDTDITGSSEVALAGQENHDHYYAAFFVRKATTNEPTVTVGAEKNVFRSW